MAIDVLVTGGNGKLGRRVCTDLRSRGYTVAQCSRHRTTETDSAWDITADTQPVPESNPNVVIHAAAYIGQYGQSATNTIPLFNTNVLGTLRVVQWCIEQEVPSLILISGAIVYGEWTDRPKSEVDSVNPSVAGPYAVSKSCAEQVSQITAQSGCCLKILRLSSLYGNEYKGLVYRLVNAGIRSGEITIAPPYDDAFDLLHVNDASRTICNAVEDKQSGTWNIGSGELTTVSQLAEYCSEQLNVAVKREIRESTRPRRILNWVDDRKARQDLGHTNTIELSDGIAEIIAAYG